jgi:hypothetical protein
MLDNLLPYQRAISTFSDFFLQNHASPTGLLAIQRSKNAMIRIFPQAQPAAKPWYYETAKAWVK